MATYIAAVSPLEARLVSRIQLREEGAFQELFHRFRSRIFHTALRILKEEASAQDALQETFLHVYRGARYFRGESRLSTWINRITVNVCLEMLRKNKRHDQRTDEDISEDTTLPDRSSRDPFQLASREETRRRVREALERLNSRHRLVVQMHDIEGFTIREIAQKLRIAEGTVKSRLFYGREALKQALTC